MNIFFVQCDGLSLLIAVALAGISAFYLVINTQLIMGDRSQGMTLDNYVLGAALLYVNTVRMFLNLLRIC